jgi:hypothetical protein
MYGSLCALILSSDNGVFGREIERTVLPALREIKSHAQ